MVGIDQHRNENWTAIDEATYDGPGSSVGQGYDEWEAFRDLIDKLEDR